MFASPFCPECVSAVESLVIESTRRERGEHLRVKAERKVNHPCRVP